MARKGLSDPASLWRLRAAKLALAEQDFLQNKRRCSRPWHDDRYARAPHFASGTPFGGKHTLRGCVRPNAGGSTRCNAIRISPNVRKKCLATVCPADGAL